MVLEIDPDQAIGMKLSEAAPILIPWLSYESIQTWQQPQIQFSINGSVRYYSLRMSSLKHKTGVLIGRMLILRNITELKESELAEREARSIAETRSSELEALNHFAATLNKASTLKEAAFSGVPILLTHVGADAAWILLSRNLEPPLLAAVQIRSGPLDPTMFNPEECLACPTYEKTLNLSTGMTRLGNCTLLQQIVPELEGSGKHLCIPLQVGERILGSLHLVFSHEIDRELKRKHFYTTVAQQFSAAIERTSLFEDIQRLAITDPLTGLFNRRHFTYLAEREIRRASRMKRPLAVIMMDLDHFKNVNDLYGHLSGDRILKETASRCQLILREIDLLARYGGEEFVFLLPECEFDRAIDVAERLRRTISDAPFITQDDLIWVTASFGVSSLPAGEESTLDLLIHDADLSLYHAKASGRNMVKA